MLADLSRPGPDPWAAPRPAGPRLRRAVAVLAALACGMLAWAAAVPAAFATPTPVPPPGGPYGPALVVPGPATIVRVVTAGGMAGWQVALIAAGAAVVAAAAAVRLDRALTAGLAGPVIAAWCSCLAWARHRPGARPARRPGAHHADRAASTHDTSLPPDATSATPDIVEFGRSLTR
jgi:hypothetical protein